MEDSAKKYNFFYHYLLLSSYFVLVFSPLSFIYFSDSLLVFFLSFILPSCLSLFITCFYRCVSLLPVSSFPLLVPSLLSHSLSFLYSFLYLFLSLYQYFSLYCALFFLIFSPLFFLLLFRFSIYTTVYLLLLFFVASSYAGLFSLPSLVSFSPNKFIRNKL